MDAEMEEPTEESIVQALEALHVDPEPSQISTLAAASRSKPHVREKLADLKVLRTLVDLVEVSLNETLETTCLALRCIGNACIDSDAGRGYFATDLGFGWAMQCLAYSGNGGDVDVGLLAIKVLYNISSEHEGAQKRMYADKVHYALWQSHALVVAHQSELTFVAELLFAITGQKGEMEATLQDTAPEVAVTGALRLPCELSTSDEDDFAMLVEAALTLLRDQSTQKQILETKRLDSVLQLAHKIEDKLDVVVEPEQAKTLNGCSTSLLWCLSDIAANPLSIQFYPFGSPEVNAMVKDVLEYCRGGPVNAHLATSACQFIGNMLWHVPPPDYGNQDLDSAALYPALLHAIEQNNDLEFLHAATGLLVMFSRASVKARETMGAHASEALSRLCQHERAEIQADGVHLLKALGKDCPVNQSRFAELAVTMQSRATSAATPG